MAQERISELEVKCEEITLTKHMVSIKADTHMVILMFRCCTKFSNCINSFAFQQHLILFCSHFTDAGTKTK